jgi:hypothetical protein
MPRLGAERGAVMVRGAEVLRWERALPHARRAKHGASHGRRSGAVAQKRMEARLLLGGGEASAARGLSAVPPASAIDRGRQRGRRSRSPARSRYMASGAGSRRRRHPAKPAKPANAVPMSTAAPGSGTGDTLKAFTRADVDAEPFGPAKLNWFLMTDKAASRPTGKGG